MTSKRATITFSWFDPSIPLPDDQTIQVISHETIDISHVPGLEVSHWYVRKHTLGIKRAEELGRLNGLDSECVDLIDWLNRRREDMHYYVRVPTERFDELISILSAPKVRLQVLDLQVPEQELEPEQMRTLKVA